MEPKDCSTKSKKYKQLSESERYKIEVLLEGKKTVPLELVEAEPGSPFHLGRINLNKLGVRPGDRVRASYGYGYMKNETELKLK